MIRFQTIDIDGFGVFGAPTSLALEDLGLVLVLGDNRDTRAAISNGAGKSTIFKAISWALYGVTIDGLKTNVVHLDASKASVYLRFKIDAAEYAITRTRTRSAGKLKLEQFVDGEWIDKSQGTKETQASIVEVLGLDWDAFRCICLFGQGDTSRFASPMMTDAARKGVLTRVLNLARYDRAREEAKARRAEFDSRIDLLNRSLTVAEKDAGALAMSIDMRENDIEEALALVDSADDDVKSAKADVKEARAELVEAREHEPEAAEALAEAKEDEDDCTEIRDAAVTAMTKAGATYNAARAKVKALEDDECPTCGAAFDVDEADRKSAAKRLAKAKKKVDRACALHIEASDEVSDTRKTSAAAANELQRVGLRVGSCELRVESREAEVEKVKERAGEALTRVDRLEAERDELRVKFDTATKAGTGCGAKIKSLATKRAAADWWVKGFGPKGVPAYAIEQALPALNAATNRHLLTLADGDLIVSWSATVTGSSGAEKEELTCLVTVEGMVGAQPSGGQWKKIELATELALAEVVRESGGPQTNLLMLDEALDGLDKEGASRVVEWLAGLDYESILVIAHGGAADSFDKTIEVVKQDGIARIEV